MRLTACLFLAICVNLRSSAVGFSARLLFLQIERRVVLYVIRIHQDTVDRLFFVLSGLAGLEELIGLFHR